MEPWEEEVHMWEGENLDQTGKYTGPELTSYGFPFKKGQYIPVDQRATAMYCFNWARTVQWRSSNPAR